ncbi:uncharacterized protein CEXT_636151, partial [Caerostris extrusa]
LEKCYRCVVLHEKHINVLQYKESHCSSTLHHQGLETLCAEINGDALLYSMFRFNTPAVPCPFKGSFVFNYSRGHGECANPPSTVDSCTDDSHLLLRFQACADVIGSESRNDRKENISSPDRPSVTRFAYGNFSGVMRVRQLHPMFC